MVVPSTTMTRKEVLLSELKPLADRDAAADVLELVELVV
jgi:hypothetical protein